MKPSALIRTERHRLAADASTLADIGRTLASYRALVRALAGLILVHDELWRAPSRCFALERLFHVTQDNPAPRYAVLDRKFHKFPSYLRRAAIEAAFGAVSSYLSNHDRWLAGRRSRPDARPPQLGQVLNVNPSLYGGQCIRVSADWRTVSVKLLGATGQWGWSAPLKVKGRLRRLGGGNKALSPTLLLDGAQAALACPVQCARPPATPGATRVCAVDVGINTAATASIVDERGTVIARGFFSCGRHNDRRDKRAAAIRRKAAQTKSLARGFCRALYRRIRGLNLQAARELAAALRAFAAEHGTTVLVFEHLKGWRPKAPRASMRQRFARFLHRALVKAVTHRAEEEGRRVAFVAPAGTSKWAYDGSGQVRWDKNNYSLCEFENGRRFNADLNASFNIAAKYLARVLKIVPCERAAAATGKSSGAAPRRPVVLSDVWAHWAPAAA